MHRVCAVVVTYRPPADVAGNLAALRLQVDRLVVVDNASTEQSRAGFAPWRDDDGFTLIANAGNDGLATALNQGMEVAERGGYDWAATFDQDSRVPEGFIAGLLAAHAKWAGRDRVGIVAPVYRDRHLGFRYSPNRGLAGDARPLAEIDVTLTSGNLVSTRAWREAGAFRADLFIDYVDFEFCLRLRRRGWRILEVRGVELGHEQGVWTQRRFLWLTPQFNDYPAARRYYQTRNRLVIFCRYFGSSPRWLLRDGWGYVKEVVKLLLFGRERMPKLRAMARGAWHALTGRRGPWSPA